MENVPHESETIAVRRAARIAERIKEAKRGLFARRAWWSNGPLEMLFLVFLFGLNFYLVVPFFGTSAVQTPFSGPIIPLLAEGIAFISKIPLFYAVQIVNIVFFLIFPFSYYFVVKKLTDRKLAAILAVLVATLPTFLFAQTRLRAMFLSFDAPHIACLSVIPFAVYGLLTFIREGGVANCFKASALTALIALISPFGLMNYLIFASIVVFSELLLGQGRLKILRLVAVLAISGGLCSFWYNPIFFFWMVTGPMGAEIRSMFFILLPMSFFIVPVLAIFGYLLFDRKPKLQPLFLAAFCSIAFAVISLARWGLGPSNPSRYLPELSISLSFLIGVLFLDLVEFIKFVKIPIGIPIVARHYLSNTIIGLIMIGIMAGIFFGRERLNFRDNKVLGLWTAIDKGEIWVARDRFEKTGSFLGTAITLLAVGGLSVLDLKSRQKRNN